MHADRHRLAHALAAFPSTDKFINRLEIIRLSEDLATLLEVVAQSFFADDTNFSFFTIIASPIYVKVVLSVLGIILGLGQQFGRQGLFIHCRVQPLTPRSPHRAHRKGMKLKRKER